MSGGVLTALDHARYLPGYELASFSASGPLLLTDYQALGHRYTALFFVVINEGAGPLTVTVETSEDGTHAEAGPFAPQPFTVAAGAQGTDRYGIDLGWLYWRIAVDGTSTGKWGIKGVPR